MNLLQPQDRGSRAPGDARGVVLARRRSLERGLGEPLLGALLRLLEGLGKGARILDVGCGEGYFLGHLAERLPLNAVGVDISSSATGAAAKRYRNVRWIVANADLRLPFGDGSFSVVLSVTGPKNSREFLRLLAPEGRLVLVISGPDDLAELRSAVLGHAKGLDRAPRMQEMFGADFALESEETVRSVARLSAAALADLAAGTYRGARHRERARLTALTELDVTLSYRILVFRPR